MADKTFEEIREEIQEKLKGRSKEEIVLFAWRCGVLSLPILGTGGNLKFWTIEKRQEHLLAILRALDLSNAAYAGDAARAAASRAAYAAAGDAAYAAANAAAYAGDAAYAAAGDAAYAAAYAYAAYAYAGDAGDAANAAAWLFNATKNLGTDREKRIQNLLENPATIEIPDYGPVWKNFKSALIAEDCEYWLNVYEEIFDSGLQTDREAALHRLNVPEEIQSQGASAVGKYLERIDDEGAETLNEARIIILGDKGAGKTCLARRLVNLSAPMTTRKESTAGVDTTLWKPKGRNLNVRIWDFAGHTVTHAVHKFFLSERCLYLLVCNGRKEDVDRLEYWLNQMKDHGENSEAIIFVNKQDNHEVKVPINRLKERFNILDLVVIDIKEDQEGLLEFREQVAEHIATNPKWVNNLIPKSYYLVKNEIEKRFNSTRKTGTNEFISQEEFLKIAEKFKVEAPETLLKDLHQLGISLWYPDIEECDKLVLNPEWISEGIYGIINWLSNQHRYQIRLGELKKVFAKKKDRYPEREHPFLFALLKHYQLAFDSENEEGLIVPHLLQEDQPADLPQFEKEESLLLKFEAGKALPPNTISRFIVHHHQQIQVREEELRVWKYGVILEDGQGSQALVREVDRHIGITVSGSSKTEFLTEIRETLITIFDSYESQNPELQYRVIDENGPKERGHSLIPERLMRGESELYLSEKEIITFLQKNLNYPDPNTGRDIPMQPTVSIYNISINSSQGFQIGPGGHQQVNQTFNFHEGYADLQAKFNELALRLERKDKAAEAAELREVAEILEEVKALKSPEEAKKKGLLGWAKGVLDDINDPDTTIHKAVNTVGKGAKIVADIASIISKLT